MNAKTPEEKLLEIIKAGQNSAAPLQRREGLSHFSIARWREYVREAVRNKAWLPKAVVLFFVCSLIVLVFSIIAAIVPLERTTPQAQGPQTDLGLSAAAYQVPAVETFVEAVRKKDIFNSAAFRKGAAGDTGLDGLNTIALLGIISEDPKQAIFKNKVTEEIHYVAEGGNLGEFRVVQILEGKVIVEFRGERFEINL